MMEILMMSEDSRAPPGKRKSRPAGAASLGFRHSSDPIVSRFGDRAQPLARLQELNRRRARITALVRRIHALGARPTVELLLEVAARLDGFAMIEELAERFAKFDPAFLRERIGRDFPAGPIREMPR
jgi:hypothetical protein